MQNNPYLGPRPYERSDRDKFFGRTRETRDLLSLIMAERVVLFYAQSGAGKTSLLNTQIIPALEEEGFYVLPAVRVGSDLPPGLPDKIVKNIFAFSVWMGLTGKETPLATMTGTTVQGAIKSWLVNAPLDENGEPRPPVLIIDQFEEILTTHRDRWQDARGFFEQLADTLNKTPKLGVVLAMREDHVAGLDPYAPLLPKRLKARFRMEQLKVDGALEAVRKPAQNAGHPFASGVAEKLVDDLRRVRMMHADQVEAETSVLGPYVEPVQLQVVCNRLWENLPEREAGQFIEWEDVEQFGNIDRALTDFYESALHQVLEQAKTVNIPVREAQLRRWFGTKLITPEQTRGLAMRGAKETESIPNAVVDMLESRHIIRADLRAGARWYEISHDRLVEPILRSNADWEATALSPLRRAALRWADGGKNPDLVYRGKVLKDALEWAEANRADCEPLDLEFLEAGQAAQAAAEKEFRQHRLIRRLAIAAFVALILASVAGVFAYRERDSAEQQRQIAEEQKQQADVARGKAIVRQLISQASESNSRFPMRNLLLGLEALQVTDLISNTAGAQSLSLDAEDTLRQVIVATGGIVLDNSTKPVALVAFSPDHRWLVSGNSDGRILLWQMNGPTPVGDPITLTSTGSGSTQSIAFSPDSKRIAGVDSRGRVQLWDLTAGGLSSPVTLPGDQKVTALTFSPEGELLIGTSGQNVLMWDATNPQVDTVKPSSLNFGNGTAQIPAVSPDGTYLAVAGQITSSPVIKLWNLTDPTAEPKTLTGHSDAITSLTFDPLSQWLASGSADATARLWYVSDPDPSAASFELRGHEEQLTSLAFTQDGKRLITGSFDTTARVWDMEAQDPSANSIVLRGHNDQILDLAVSPDNRWLFTASRDGTVRVWDLFASDMHDTSASYVLRGPEGPVSTIDVSSDSRALVAGSDDGTTQVWGVTTPNVSAAPIVLRGHTSVVRGVPIDKNNHWLATYGGDGIVRLWDLTAPEPAAKSIALPGHTGSIYAGAISPDGRWLATGSQDTTARVWDLSAPDPAHTATVLKGHTGALRTVNFSPDSHWLVTAGRDGIVRLWDMTAHDIAKQPIELKGHTSQVRVSEFSHDGTKLITGGDAGNPRLWDLSTLASGTASSTILPAGGSIRAVDFSPDDRWVAAGGTDNVVRLWDLTAANPPSSTIELKGHTGAVRAIQFTPNGKWLVTAGADKLIYLWDMSLVTSTGKLTPTFTLQRHNGEVRALDVSADSHWLMSGSEDGTARLWDLTAADPSAYSIDFPGHGGPVWSVVISPDNKWFATASQDATGRLWHPVSLDDIKQVACRMASRNLSMSEWLAFGGIQANYNVTCPNYPPGEGAPAGDAAQAPTPTPAP